MFFLLCLITIWVLGHLAQVQACATEPPPLTWFVLDFPGAPLLLKYPMLCFLPRVFLTIMPCFTYLFWRLLRKNEPVDLPSYTEITWCHPRCDATIVAAAKMAPASGASWPLYRNFPSPMHFLLLVLSLLYFALVVLFLFSGLYILKFSPVLRSFQKDTIQ